MTKLKTLKDINGIALDKFQLGIGKGEIALVPREDLRQEAIKWVKAIYHKYNKNGIMITGGSEGDKIDWIKHFFNLTEEDLK